MEKAQKIWLLLAAICLFVACNSGETQQVESPAEAPADSLVIDLAEIRERGKLVLLTENSSISYYLYRGQAMGFDYEMVREFARANDLELEVRVLEDLNDMFQLLNEGKGDLIACNLAITDDRQGLVDFTMPLAETRQVLVQQNPTEPEDSLIDECHELDGRELFVHRYSSFYENIVKREASDSSGVEIIEASGNIDSEQMIRLVAEGQIDLTLADENMAMLNATYYDNIDISMHVSDGEQIAWAVRKDSDSLLLALNEWIENRSTKRRLAYTYQKYFVARKDQQARVQSPFSSLSGKQISEFDNTIQEYSSELRWDWKLLAAMIYQESRFNPEARSWAGAFGLMQLMPNTAKRFGIDTTHTRERNIRAGVAYLKYLDNFWRNRIHDPQERVKFILASYNVGPGHVQDAQRIAQHVGKNPYVWDNNVSDCLLLKSEQKYLALEGVKHGYCRGKEPVQYVRNVISQYSMYQSMEL